jgi:hypothetical protein
LPNFAATLTKKNEQGGVKVNLKGEHRINRESGRIGSKLNIAESSIVVHIDKIKKQK